MDLGEVEPGMSANSNALSSESRPAPSATRDEALQVLRQKYEEVDPDFPFALVKSCYSIERKFQYEREREVPLNEIRAQVTVVVENSMKESDADSQ